MKKKINNNNIIVNLLLIRVELLVVWSKVTNIGKKYQNQQHGPSLNLVLRVLIKKVTKRELFFFNQGIDLNIKLTRKNSKRSTLALKYHIHVG